MSGQTSGRRRTRAVVQPVVMPSLEAVKGTEEFDTRTERALADLADAVNQLGGGTNYVADIDLALGTNTIEHGLGREPAMVQVAPTTADVNFGWGWDPVQAGNPRPKMLIHITVAGTAMTARVIIE